MSEFSPIKTVADLNNQDESEILLGYFSGGNGDPEPGSMKSRSFWHGWRNGMADYRHMKIDDAQVALAAEFVRQYRSH